MIYDDTDCERSFIRDDEEPGEVSWKERLARAYESKLFKEFALVRIHLHEYPYVPSLET